MHYCFKLLAIVTAILRPQRAENRRLVNKVRDSGRVCRSALNSLSSFRLILATTKEIISEHNPSVLAESWIAEAEAVGCIAPFACD